MRRRPRLLRPAACGLTIDLLAIVDASDGAAAARRAGVVLEIGMLAARRAIGDVGPLRRAPAGRAIRQVGPRIGLATARGAVLEAAPEFLALVGARPHLVEALAGRGIAIGHALAVDRLVLPATVVDVVDVEVAVDVDRAIDVHVDIAVAASPVPAAEDRAGGSDADTEHQAAQQGGAIAVARRRWIVGRRIGRIGPGAVDGVGIVGRHVDHFRVRRGDDDRAVGSRSLRGDRLLLAALQIAGVGRPGAQALDRIGDILLLGDHRVADLLHPVEIVAELAEDLREGDQ